jgi:hypothetical protein
LASLFFETKFRNIFKKLKNSTFALLRIASMSSSVMVLPSSSKRWLNPNFRTSVNETSGSLEISLKKIRNLAGAEIGGQRAERGRGEGRGERREWRGERGEGRGKRGEGEGRGER